jgi:hypothetical protein
MTKRVRQCVSPDDFRSIALEMWGAEVRTGKQLFDRDLPLIQDRVDFGSASAELKVHLAETMIRESTHRCGAYEENGDPRWYLQSFAREMAVRNPVFDTRRMPALRAAILLLGHQHFGMFQPIEVRDQYGDLNAVFGMGGSAVASVYLLSQLEYLFRVKGNHISVDGKLTKLVPTALSAVQGLQRKHIGSPVNQIHLAFRLYLEGSADSLGRRLERLDQDVHIAARLSRIRSPTMHGTIGDSSGEGLFYGFLTAMFYYSEPIAQN